MLAVYLCVVFSDQLFALIVLTTLCWVLPYIKDEEVKGWARVR